MLCDEYVTQAANDHSKLELPYPGSKSMVSINGKWITSNVEQRLTEAATGSEMKKYIIGRFKWSEEDCECVNWQAILQDGKGVQKLIT